MVCIHMANESIINAQYVPINYEPYYPQTGKSLDYNITYIGEIDLKILPL